MGLLSIDITLCLRSRKLLTKREYLPTSKKKLSPQDGWGPPKVCCKSCGRGGISTPTSFIPTQKQAKNKRTDTDTSNTGNVTLDFAANQNFVLTLTGNTTLVNPTTEQVGQSGFIAFIQDGTGGRTITLGTDYETAGGATSLTLSTAANAVDILPYFVKASGSILLGAPQLAFS